MVVGENMVVESRFVLRHEANEQAQHRHQRVVRVWPLPEKTRSKTDRNRIHTDKGWTTLNADLQAGEKKPDSERSSSSQHKQSKQEREGK